MSARPSTHLATLLKYHLNRNNLVEARLLFESPPYLHTYSWCLLFRAYLQKDEHHQVLSFYDHMRESGRELTNFVFPLVLKACSKLCNLARTEHTHACLIKHGFSQDLHVASALVNAYLKCDKPANARHVFERMQERNFVVWTAMIVGSIQTGSYAEALDLFGQMMQANVSPNEFTLAAVLLACSKAGLLWGGRVLHGYIIKNGFDHDVYVLSSIINLYGCCGSLEHASQVFEQNGHRDTAVWNAIISCYGMHGVADKAISTFETMARMPGVKPDKVTFIHLLSACSQAGRLDEGLKYFQIMVSDFQMPPSADHYACLIDLLGRHGRVEDAGKYMRNMPFEPDGAVLGAMLNACKIHGKADLGKQIAERLFKLEPGNVGNYVILSNTFAEAGRWEEQRRVRHSMKEMGLQKRPGCSWIEVKREIHVFTVGDPNHPRFAEIKQTMGSLYNHTRYEGRFP